MAVADATSSILQQALTRTVTEEGAGALYKGLMPNILRGMSMNVGMLACYDQAKEGVAAILNDPMTNGPALTTQIGASCVAVSISTFFTC
jgi:solute carrier family 25 oxoglutarate transporter 11